MQDIVEKLTDNLTWYNHACISISGSKILYFDPYKLPQDAPKADYVLTTHSHSDHFSLNAINKIITDSSTVFLTEDTENFLNKGKVFIFRPL